MKLLLVHKNFAAAKGISHIGLGQACKNTAATLRQEGYEVRVKSADTVQDIELTMLSDPHITHVAVAAPWIPTNQLEQLVSGFKHVQFVVISHSNIGFLSADPNGVKLLTEYGGIQDRHPNFHVAGNCLRFKNAWEAMYGRQVLLLPNLYDLSTVHQPKPYQGHRGRALRIGLFGATRVLKGFLTGAASALIVSRILNKHVHVYMNSGREDGGQGVVRAIEQLIAAAPKASLIRVPWAVHSEFIETVGKMDLLIQPSATESFLQVVADGISRGVPAVVSQAVPWTPKGWQRNLDDATDIAEGAVYELHHRYREAEHGREALHRYVRTGLLQWHSFLGNQR